MDNTDAKSDDGGVDELGDDDEEDAVDSCTSGSTTCSRTPVSDDPADASILAVSVVVTVSSFAFTATSEPVLVSMTDSAIAFVFAAAMAAIVFSPKASVASDRFTRMAPIAIQSTSMTTRTLTKTANPASASLPPPL